MPRKKPLYPENRLSISKHIKDGRSELRAAKSILAGHLKQDHSLRIKLDSIISECTSILPEIDKVFSKKGKDT